MTTLSGLSTLASSGVALALPYAAGMQSSLPILQKNYKFSKVFFWGKLAGMTADYLIAKGIEESYEQVKFFFWCVSRRADPGCRQLDVHASARRLRTPGVGLSRLGLLSPPGLSRAAIQRSGVPTRSRHLRIVFAARTVSLGASCRRLRPRSSKSSARWRPLC